MPDDPVCHSEACAGHNCPRSTHRFGGFLSSGADRRYLGCTTHRRCEAFEQVEPLASLPLEPLSEVERAAIGQRLDLAEELLAAVPTWPEEAAYWTDDADGDPGGPMRQEVATDERRLTVEAPVGAAPPETNDCCAGEPAYGDPRGMHSDDCPVYLASVAAYEASQRAKHKPPPVGPRQLPAFSVDEHFPTPIESYDAWRCTSCWSRSLRPGRCCKRAMRAIRVVMYDLEAT